MKPMALSTRILGQVVALFRSFLGFHAVVIVNQLGVVLVRVSTEEAIVTLEASPQWPAIIRAGRRGLIPGVRCHFPSAKVL